MAWLTQAKYHYRLTHRSQYDKYDLRFPPGLAAVPGHDEKDEGKAEAIGFLSRLDESQRRAFEAKFGIVAGRLPEQARIRELVSTAHARDGALKRDGAGWYEIVAPL